MTTEEHITVKRQARDRRNAGARARRATLSDRLADVTCIAAELPGGETVLVALTAADDSRAYVLHRVDNRWRCGCFNARFSVSRTCAHETAAAQQRGPT